MTDNDDLFLKFSFMSSVHALVLVELLRSKEVPQHIVMDLMMVTNRAFALAHTVPPDRGPAMAAFEFTRHYMMMHAEDRTEPGYGKPDWLPEPEPVANEEWEEPTETFIEGRWVTADPRWDGLPGETVLELDIAALLRERPALRPIEIAKALSKSESRVLSALDALKHERAVIVSGRPARWSLSQSVVEILETLPRRQAPSPSEGVQPPTIEDRILAALQTRSEQRYREIAAAVSLSETYIRRLLQQMARKDLVKASSRPARWSLAKTGRPLKAEPKPRPAAKGSPQTASAEASSGTTTLLTAKRPRRPIPKGLERPLNNHIVNDIVAVLGRRPTQGYFAIAVEISIAEDTIRRYLHDLESLAIVQQVGQRPMRWSLTANWAAALEESRASVVTDTRQPKRLARVGRSAAG